MKEENIVNVKSQTKLSSFSVVFHGSVLNEEEGQLGINHLCEHLLAKSFDHLIDDFNKYAIEWEAYTSGTDIVFKIEGLEYSINQYKFKFLDSLMNGYELTQEILDRELQIIYEEYLDSFNSQIHSHLKNLLRKKFNYYSPIGEKNNILNFDLQKVNDYIKKYFSKPSKIINIVDNEDSFITREDLNFKDFSTNYINKDFYFDDYDVPLQLNNEFNDKESIFFLSPIVYENIPELKFIMKMLGYDINSPLMQELREKKGLVYFVASSFYRLNDENGFCFIATQTSKGNHSQIYNIISEIFNNYKNYITKKRFDQIMNFLKITHEKDNIEIHKNEDNFIKPQKFNLEENLNRMTYQKILDVFDKIFNIDNWYFSVDHHEFK